MTRAFRLTVRPSAADLILLMQIVEMRFQLRNGDDGIVSRELADRLHVLDPGKTPEEHYASFALDMLGQWDIEPIRGGPVAAVTGGPSADPWKLMGLFALIAPSILDRPISYLPVDRSAPRPENRATVH